ncbi:MAG: hypothetical protein ACO3JG_12245 [Luteolibacter sp.]
MISCSDNHIKDDISDCNFRSICGIVPSANFKSEITTSTFAQFSFISSHNNVLSWVYNWPAVSSNFEHMPLNEFLDLHAGHLEESGQVLFTGENLAYWFNGTGKLYDARCRIIKTTGSKSECIIEISYLDDLN